MQDRSIQIVVNGLNESVPGDSTIASLIAQFGEDDSHLIVEYNGRFVYPQKYGEILVRDGDRLEFINPNFGG
jgi:thiamine biosynthesis protein ThiS